MPPKLVDWTCPNCGTLYKQVLLPVHTHVCPSSYYYFTDRPSNKPAVPSRTGGCAAQGALVDAIPCVTCRTTGKKESIRFYQCSKWGGLVSDRHVPESPLPVIRNCRGCIHQSQHEPPATEPLRFIRLTDLQHDALALASKLPPISEVIGIARSGMLPAVTIATVFGARLFAYDLESNRLSECGKGYRFQKLQPEGHTLLIDDSTWNGTSFSKALAAVKEKRSCTVISAALYTRPGNPFTPDLHVRSLASHLFEWNIYDSPFHHTVGFDMDGIYSPDFTEAEMRPEVHLEALRNKRPMVRSHKPTTIITARHISAYQETLAWFHRHGINVQRLICWPFPSAERTWPAIGRWKAEQVLALGLKHYVESDLRLAQEIAKHTQGKFVVIHPASGKVLL